MIKNLIFDLGNVLVEFKPEKYLNSLNIPDSKKLSQIIFEDNRWTECDRGTIQIKDYIADLKKENPKYSVYLDLIFGENWVSNFFKVKEESVAFLKQVAKKYNIFILSNISEYVLNYIKTLDFFTYVTSGTYSYLVKSCKPDEKIYHSLLQENKLLPQECLFLDDIPANIEIAKKLGMNGIVFHDNIQEIISFFNQDN